MTRWVPGGASFETNGPSRPQKPTAGRAPIPDPRCLVTRLLLPLSLAYPTSAGPKPLEASGRVSGDAEREPLAAVPVLVGDVVDEAREDSNEPVVLRASAADG